MPREVLKMPFSCFAGLNRGLEDCKAWVRAFGRLHDRILDQQGGLPLPGPCQAKGGGGGGGTNAARARLFVCWLLNAPKQANVSQGRICTDNFTCCHTETEVADQTFYLTQSQYTDTGPTSSSADPITPDAWQGSLWSANF